MGCIGEEGTLSEHGLTQLEGVDRVMPVLKPYKLASREFSAGSTAIQLGDPASTVIGGRDVVVIPVLKRETHLPVIVDPSHAGGRAHLVTPLALAAVAAGADGLIVEVHPNPTCAKSDGEQSLAFDVFGEMMRQVQAVARAVDRDCAVSAWREEARA